MSFAALQTTDRILQREWRDSGPLPSSLERTQAIDSLLSALPPVPGPARAFAPKRIHRPRALDTLFDGTGRHYCVCQSAVVELSAGLRARSHERRYACLPLTIRVSLLPKRLR